MFSLHGKSVTVFIYYWFECGYKLPDQFPISLIDMNLKRCLEIDHKFRQ